MEMMEMGSNVGNVEIKLKIDPPTGDLFSGRQKAIERLTPLAMKNPFVQFALSAHRAGRPLLETMTDALLGLAEANAELEKMAYEKLAYAPPAKAHLALHKKMPEPESSERTEVSFDGYARTLVPGEWPTVDVQYRHVGPLLAKLDSPGPPADPPADSKPETWRDRKPLL